MSKEVSSELQELKKLRILRGQYKSTITRILNFVKDPVQYESASSDLLEARKDKLIIALKNYEAVQLDVLSMDENDKEQVGDVEETYYFIMSKINASLKQMSQKIESDSHSVSTCKLPNIDIPTFDGKDFTAFKPFYELYIAVIHNNRSLSNVQKLFYLRKYLKDDALAVIINLPLVNQSYDEALCLLKKRFDNKARLVSNHINIILDLAIMQKSTASSIRSFVSQVQQQLHALKNLNEPIEKWDMILIAILTRKLDQVTNRAYQLDRDSNKMPSMADFIEFLEKRAIALEDSSPSAVTPSYEHFSKFKFPNKVSNVAANINVCKFCSKSNHRIYSCPQYKILALNQRLSFAQEHKLCPLCLNAHIGKCKLNIKCKLCQLAHNTLLHQEPQAVEPVVSLLSKPLATNVLLPTVKVKLVDMYGEPIVVRALLDTGSQDSFATTNIVKKLGLSPIVQHKSITGIGNKPTAINEYVNLTVLSCQNNVKFNLKCNIVQSITTRLPQQFINIAGLNLPKHIKLSDDTFNTPGEISVLLSADVYFNSLLDGCIKIDNGPVLQNTVFGYIVGGNYHQNLFDKDASFNGVSNFAISDTIKLENVMESFWSTEKIPDPVKQDCDEFKKAEDIFQRSVKLENNRFFVDMPLTTTLDNLQLGDSFSVAYQRFLCLEKRFKTNPLLLEQYKLFIDEYVTLGHAKKVNIGNYDVRNGPVYFLAHHAVINESSKTTKLRVVFDGSMKSRSSVALNDVMLNGPVVQRELFDILLLFRTYQFTLICDIQKMFRMCYINPQQTSLQNILWRDDPSKPIICLQLQTVTYGLKSSTFLATRCLLELAQRYSDKYPLAAQTLLSNTYVDDIIAGRDNVEQIIELKKQLVELLQLGSFTLHKWCSNHPEVLSDIPAERRQFETIDLSKSNFVKTLGLMYDISSDTFTFTCPDIEVSPNTKRLVLSFIGKIFDPLGLIGPIVIVAKIFMQELWSLQLDWDSIMPHPQFSYWQKYLNNLKEMCRITVNRRINYVDAISIELIGYSDASIKAYACCLYLRIIKKDGVVETNLICAKSRVAPLSKNLTIPQLELSAALLLGQLVSRVGKLLTERFPNKVYLYTDSQIVLAWIKNGNVKLNAFTNNRVSQILELTQSSQWYYVRSGDNPADLLSRGILPQKLQQTSLWWHGPIYLKNLEFQHDCTIIFNFPKLLSDEETPVLHCSATQAQDSVTMQLFNRFSSFNKLQRVIGYIYRFFNNCLKSNRPSDIHLNPQELRNSMWVIVRCTQAAYFGKELESLTTGKEIKTGIANLNPFIDQVGVLRVGGRLHNAEKMSYDKKHPIILPKKCHITNLLIEKEHLRLLHAGPRLVLSSLQQKITIVSGIREVKRVLRKCVKCVRFKAEAARQMMGSLPIERITASRPFQYVGVDFCGPFQLKVARIRKPIITKGYVALFVCFAVKAVHVELVSDLTTEAFLACLKRFISRRGMPTKIFCDNAKTFVGASNTLKQLYDLQTSKNHRDAVNSFCSQNYIKFRFIPSYSPEFGGLWEAGVKSVKHHFKRVVGNLTLTYEEFYTVIVQIEGVLNSRPLLADNSIDCNYLTPGHFLVGTALTSYPEIDLTDFSTNRLKFWNICTKLKQDFWKSWSKDYINQLQSRPKWKYQHPNLKEGELVLIKGLNLSPLQWPMARIVKTYPGSDNRVRVADVKFNNKVYRRSINTLCPLPLN